VGVCGWLAEGGGDCRRRYETTVDGWVGGYIGAYGLGDWCGNRTDMVWEAIYLAINSM